MTDFPTPADHLGSLADLDGLTCPRCGHSRSSSGKLFTQKSLTQHLQNVHSKKKVETEPGPKTVLFRDYKHYPSNIMEAAHFRDDFDEEPDGAFFAIAEEMGLTDALIEMAEWEAANTYRKEDQNANAEN